MTTSRIPSTTPLRLLAIMLGTLAALLVLASSADAKVYCVSDPNCPAGGVPQSTLSAAVTAADVDATPDTVRLGSGVFSSPAVSPSQPIDIVGAGMGATQIDRSGSTGTFVTMINGGSRIADLTLHLTASGQSGLHLQHGADAQRVKVTASHNLTGEAGIFAEDPGSDIQSVVVDLGPDLQGYAINDDGGGTISDSTLTAGIGMYPAAAGTIARRLTVRATFPLDVLGGTLNVANALVLPHPDDPNSPNFTGADVRNGNDGTSGLLNAADLTIVGGGFGAGIDVRPNTSVATGTSTAHVYGAIFRGLSHDITRSGTAVHTGDVTIANSSYNAASVQDSAGNGAFTPGVGNLTTGLDPKFVNPAAGDYRLRSDSPLLDKGPTSEPLSSDDPDLAGQSRVRDGDGNGTAVRDIGAYEFQPTAPPVSVPVQPQPAGTPSGTTGTTGTATASPAFALSGLSQSARVWRAGTAAPRAARRAPVGTTFRFTLNQPAKVRLAFTQRVGGRRVGRRCVAQTKRNAHSAKCMRTATAGTLSIAAHAGANRLAFQGRLSRTKRLQPGRYTLVVSATNAAGRPSVPRALTFTIVKR